MLPLMTSDEIQRALADISAETDPTLKHLKLASLVSAIFRERGIELIVVGGSAIEFFTEGASNTSPAISTYASFHRPGSTFALARN